MGFKPLELPRRPKALLDRTVAIIFQIETKYLNRIVSRNKKKFPEDFCFVLTDEEVEILKCQNVTSNPRAFNRSNPKAFTWEGCNSIALLLRSDQAVQKSVEIIRAFTTFERLNHSTVTDLPQMISSAVVHDRRLIKAVVNEIDFIKTAMSSMQNRLDSLEELLHTHTRQIEKAETACISPEQAEELRKIVKRKSKNRKQMHKIWHAFKEPFALNRYSQLQASEFNKAISQLKSFKVEQEAQMSRELLVVMMIMFSLAKCQTGKEIGTFFDKEIDPKKLAIEYKITTGKDLRYQREYERLYPLLATKFNVGNKVRWLLLLIYPGLSVPDVSYVEAHVFDENWKLIIQQSFPTGYRQSIQMAYVMNAPQLQQDVLVILVAWTLEQEPIEKQYYGFANNQFFLIRMVDDENKLVRNDYTSTIPWKGPSPIQLNKEQYFTNLNSQNPVQVLQTLVWLTGLHQSSKVRRLRSISQEPVEASKLFEVIRKDTKTPKVLQKLRAQKNKWIKEYAMLEILEEDHTEPSDFLIDDEQHSKNVCRIAYSQHCIFNTSQIKSMNKEIKVKYIILLLVTLTCLNAQQDISNNSLILSLTNSSKVIYLNKSLTTTIAVKNTSSQVLFNLQLELKLPNALEYVSSQPQQNTKKTFRWKIPKFGAQQTKVFKITTRGVLQGVYSLKTSLSIPYNGLLLNVCQRDALIKIMGGVGSRVGFQYDTDDPVEVGQQTVYVFGPRNEGTSEATKIWVINHLPQKMEFVKAEGPTEYWYDPKKKTVIFSPVQVLSPGEKLVYKIYCKAIKVGSATNTIKISYDQFSRFIISEEPTSIYE